MATPPAPTTPAPKVLNWAEAEKHLATVKNKIFEFAGKSGHNPYMWWAKHGEPLEGIFADDKRKTDVNHAKVMALAFEVPKAPDLGVSLRKPTPKPVQ